MTPAEEECMIMRLDTHQALHTGSEQSPRVSYLIQTCPIQTGLPRIYYRHEYSTAKTRYHYSVNTGI